MLTKNDLKEIAKIIDNRIQPVEERVGGMEKAMSGVEERVGGMEKAMSGVEERMGGMEKELKGIKKKVHRIDATTQVMARLFDSADVELHKRVKKIEDHLGLTSTH